MPHTCVVSFELMLSFIALHLIVTKCAGFYTCQGFDVLHSGALAGYVELWPPAVHIFFIVLSLTTILLESVHNIALLLLIYSNCTVPHITAFTLSFSSKMAAYRANFCL